MSQKALKSYVISKEERLIDAVHNCRHVKVITKIDFDPINSFKNVTGK